MPAKTLPRWAGAWILGAAALGTPGQADATEAAAGHYVIGAYAAPGAGVVPPEPGVYWNTQLLYYQGSLSRSTQLPIGGRIEAGLEASFFSAAITALYVPRLELGPFTLAFGITLPLQSVNAEVSAAARSRSSTTTSFGDMVITPFMLGWHSGQNFAQFRLDVFAPTGEYDANSISNVGMNYWTFTPTLAYTRLGANYDLSISAGIDINTRNAKTDYTSGAMLHIDASAVYDIAPGFGVGVIGAMMYQIADDSGGLAARLNGFRGRSYAIGPIVRYNFQIGGAHFNAMLSWAPEFGVRNRPTGDAIQFRISGRF